MRFAPALAALVTGLALYVSGGVLDEVLTAGGPVRVALLPPWQALGGFLGLAAIGLLLVDRGASLSAAGRSARLPMGWFVLPAFGLSVLLLPYLPVVSDSMQALQMLAGPLRYVIWMIVAIQVVWVLWQAGLVRTDLLKGWAPGHAALLIGVATACVSGLAAAKFTGSVLYPSGDEPHYLIIAQSLWRDGDLAIENNHVRQDYKEYFARDLEPHFVTRGADGAIYSIHPIGLPVVMAPVYGLAGYPGVVAGLVLAAALAARLMWLACLRATGDAGAATFAWAAVALTSPFLFNSFAVYPEIPAALAVAIVYTRVLAPAQSAPTWLAIGLACASLPWLSTKYAPMSAALVAVSLARIVWPVRIGERSSGDVIKPILLVLAPYTASLAGWFLFFNAYWGSPWPQAPYGALVQTSPLNLIFGAPGLLFDQEYGLLAYAPVYVLAATGLWWMWRGGGEARRRAIEIAVTFAALLATVGAFRIWWGGSASPGRPLTSGLLLLALPIAVAFQRAAAGSATRAAQHLLLSLSIGVAGVLFFAQGGFLIVNDRDGTSALLGFLSPRWPAWSVAPSFTYHEPPTALAYTALWIALAALAAFALQRVRTAHAGAASLAAIGVTATAFAAGAVLAPRIPADPAWPAIDVRARSRLPVLDSFDAVARPIGIEYRPLRLVPAAAVTREATLEVDAGLRRESQPVRVLHNGRFSLPAGRYRIDVDWNGARQGESIALQIGRTGEAWRRWQVEPRPGEHWATEFTMPLDAEFVGLRGTPELERSIGRISIVALSVVDTADRPRLPPVIGASSAGAVSYYYFDENALPEAEGFWVRGGRTTRVAFHRERDGGPLRLELNSGLIRNRLHLSTAGWSQAVELEPRKPTSIEIPADGRTLFTLQLTADESFVPRDLDPASQDPRALGVWIEMRER